MVGGGGQSFTTLGIFIDFEHVQPTEEEKEIFDVVAKGMSFFPPSLFFLQRTCFFALFSEVLLPPMLGCQTSSRGSSSIKAIPIAIHH
jgi:hypothetical protein